MIKMINKQFCPDCDGKGSTKEINNLGYTYSEECYKCKGKGRL